MPKFVWKRWWFKRCYAHYSAKFYWWRRRIKYQYFTAEGLKDRLAVLMYYGKLRCISCRQPLRIFGFEPVNNNLIVGCEHEHYSTQFSIETVRRKLDGKD